MGDGKVVGVCFMIQIPLAAVAVVVLFFREKSWRFCVHVTIVCCYFFFFFFLICDLAGWRSKSFLFFFFSLLFLFSPLLMGLFKVPSLILYIMGKVRKFFFSFFFFFSFLFFFFSFFSPLSSICTVYLAYTTATS